MTRKVYLSDNVRQHFSCYDDFLCNPTTQVGLRRCHLFLALAPKIPFLRFKVESLVQKIFPMILCLLLGACASPSTKVEPIPVAERISQLCIKENKKVFMDDFLPEVRQQIEEHDIKTELLTPNSRCDYIMTYDAQWSWDWFWSFSVYLSMAEFSIIKDDHQIGMASYTASLGPSALGKTKNKIRPLLIELFRK